MCDIKSETTSDLCRLLFASRVICALFKRKTTEKVAGRGWFEPAEHPLHGPVFRITAAGRAVLAQTKRETR